MSNTHFLSVKEASQHCYELGLPRSTKSLRRWCAKEEIEAQKRQTSHGEKWFIDRASLEIKIHEELEFLKQAETSLTHPDNMAGHRPDMSASERIRADVSGYEQTRPDASAHEHSKEGAHGSDMSSPTQLRDLEDQILLLKNDIKWRDQVLKEQKNSNQILMDEVKGQSRYIGHLETNVLQLGGTSDQTFLAAPVPKSRLSEDLRTQTETVAPEIIQKANPHPDQSRLYR